MIFFCKCSRPSCRKASSSSPNIRPPAAAGAGIVGNPRLTRGFGSPSCSGRVFRLVQSARLTTWAAQAVANAIRRETALEPAIKPPNDVYLNGRKVAGVLVETKAGRGQSFVAIVGIGVNINQAPHEFPDELRARAGSLAMALGRKINRTEFAVTLLHELERTREVCARGTGGQLQPGRARFRGHTVVLRCRKFSGPRASQLQSPLIR